MNKLWLSLVLFAAQAVSAMPITAQSWLVADAQGHVLHGENTDQPRSIASITKIMTAMVVLDANQDLDQKLGPYTRRELIFLAMVQSSNKSADVLCLHYPGGKDACIVAMNARAQQLAMYNTTFVDPTGLGADNMSTSQDLVKLVLAAQQYQLLVDASQQGQITVGEKKSRTTVRNTNPTVNSNYWMSKTGYIRAAGGCIVMMLDTEIGRRIVVLLGSRDTRSRIREANFIARLF